MPNNKIKFRYGICQNSHMEETGKPCPLCQSKEIQRVIATKELVCSECKAKLKEIPRPITFWEKYGKMIIAGIVVLIIGVAGAILFLSGDDKDAESISITLNHVQKTLKVGDRDTLVTTIIPEDPNASIIWQTGGGNVVKVNNGIVEAVAEGSDSVVVQVLLNGEKASVVCNYTVTAGNSTDILISELSISEDDFSLKVGDEKELHYKALPEQNDEQVTFESEDPAVATVIDGMVKAVKAGKTKILAKSSKSSKTASVTITVKGQTTPPDPKPWASYASFDGTTMTFKKKHIIPGTDQIASPGDKVTGKWVNGEVNLVRWYHDGTSETLTHK